MVSVFSFPDGSSLVNKVWNPSVSFSSLYRIENKVLKLSSSEFPNVLARQKENALGAYSLDVQTGDITEHKIGCSGAFNLMLGLETLTICFTADKTSHVYVEEGFNSDNLSLLSKLDPSLLATDYYGLSRNIRPLSVLCFDDFRVSLYSNVGSGLDLDCNYVLMQDEQEIGYFGANLSGGTINPIPVTAKGLRRYLLAQNTRKLAIKSSVEKEDSDALVGVVRMSSARSKALSFFEDVSAGNEVTTGSWMNLVYAPDRSFFTHPTAAIVGVRQCNTESVELADEVILEGSETSYCFSKLAECV